MAKKLKPVHPGEILGEEFMKPLGLSMNRLSLDLRVPLTRIADIVNARRRVTADTALRLAQYFRNTPTFWMNLQTRYDWKLRRTRSPLELTVTCGHRRRLRHGRPDQKT